MVRIFCIVPQVLPRRTFLGGAYRFIEKLQKNALSRQTRISFLGGDVHSPVVVILKTLSKAWRFSAPDPTLDHRYMLDVVSSTF